MAAKGAYSLPARSAITSRCVRPLAGLTLMELLVAVAILAFVIMLTASSLNFSLSAARTTTVTGLARSEAERIVQQIARDIRYSSALSDGWDFPSDTANTSISFSRCSGWDAENQQKTWGPITTYEWQIDSDAGEDDDGIDNNENGVVDEGSIYCQRGESARVRIGRNIEKSSLLLWRESSEDGDIVTIRISVAKFNPAHPTSIVRGAYQTTVSLRN